MFKLNNLSCGYDDNAVLKDITLSIKKGSITTIIGRNGSGKSTLLKTMARLIPIVDGEIMLEDKSIYDYSAIEFAKKVAVLPQSRNVPAMTVDSFVGHGRFPWVGLSRKFTEKDIQLVESALNITKIKEFRRRDIRTLSGGERQKAYLAMAIAQDSEIVFLDEPTTFLDIEKQFEFLELIKDLSTRGKTVIMVLHDLNHALQYSDYIAVVGDGMLKAFGTPQEIITKDIFKETFGLRMHTAVVEDKNMYFFSRDNKTTFYI